MGWEETLRSVAFALARFSSFTANALLFGLVPVLLFVLRPVFSGLPADDVWSSGRRRVAARLEGLAQAALAASVAATLIALLLQAVLTSQVLSGGDLGTASFESVIDSSFGRWYLLRLPVLAALAILLVGRVRAASLAGAGDEKSAPSPIWWGAWALLAFILLATSSFSGHSAVATPHWLALSNDMVHLAAGGTWFAGIVLFAVALPDGWRGQDEVGRLRLLAPAVARFSRLALVSVGVVAVTGVVSSLLHVGALSDLVDTGYGRALAIKIFVFLGILGLGALNHFVLRERMNAAVEGTGDTSSLRLFRRSIAAELSIALAIFGITGVLTGLGRTRQDTAAPPRNQVESARVVE